MYDVNTVETINGSVLSVDQISHGNRMSMEFIAVATQKAEVSLYIWDRHGILIIRTFRSIRTMILL
ncbi:MAG: hypothetical protein IPM38_05810 [Ignavibacteria bacterium]|nr:hypothetical protein [Ignavibacteria bacterium]